MTLAVTPLYSFEVLRLTKRSLRTARRPVTRSRPPSSSASRCGISSGSSWPSASISTTISPLTWSSPTLERRRLAGVAPQPHVADVRCRAASAITRGCRRCCRRRRRGSPTDRPAPFEHRGRGGDRLARFSASLYAGISTDTCVPMCVASSKQLLASAWGTMDASEPAGPGECPGGSAASRPRGPGCAYTRRARGRAARRRSSMRTLVTGAHRLCRPPSHRAPVAKGDEVIGVDRHQGGVDITDAGAVQACSKGCGPRSSTTWRAGPMSAARGGLRSKRFESTPKAR